MNVPLLLEMSAATMPERTAVVAGRTTLTYGELRDRAWRLAYSLHEGGTEQLLLIDTNSEALPIALFGAAAAGVPFVPLNYRLPRQRLATIAQACLPALAVVGEDLVSDLPPLDRLDVVARATFLDRSRSVGPPPDPDPAPDPSSVAILLHTSGTTAEPKVAVLRQSHLAAYILNSVEHASAGPEEATLVSVPPYHVAGIAAVLSAIYAGRRIVYLESFDPKRWVDVAREQGVTHAMVVPTMLGRIIDVLESDPVGLPAVRTLSYGGGPMPVATVERALRALPHVGFVNAYGLTETASTISLLGPADHRAAIESTDPDIRRRLASVGRPLPGISIEVRGQDSEPLPPGQIGEVWVHGAQVSGEYVGNASAADGWFCTRDSGSFDRDGFLYLSGRQDDVIVRGGENIAPAEVEEVLLQHPSVEHAAVYGVPDPEWGEAVAAAVVLIHGSDVGVEELRSFARSRLRSARTPQHIEFRDELPINETGKVLRRSLRAAFSRP